MDDVEDSVIHGHVFQRLYIVVLLRTSRENTPLWRCRVFWTTRSSATAEIARDADDALQGHSRSSVIVPVNEAYFILALNGNLTSNYNRSGGITLSLHIHTSPYFRVELEKDGWE